MCVLHARAAHSAVILDPKRVGDPGAACLNVAGRFALRVVKDLAGPLPLPNHPEQGTLGVVGKGEWAGRVNLLRRSDFLDLLELTQPARTATAAPSRGADHIDDLQMAQLRQAGFVSVGPFHAQARTAVAQPV